MGVRVAVAGASGYAGGELLRLLAGHSGFELGAVTAGSQAGQPVTAIHPGLVQLGDRTLEPTDPQRLARADLVFLALPPGRSAAVAAQLPGTVKVVDLGADFRLADPAAWHEFYGGPGEPDIGGKHPAEPVHRGQSENTGHSAHRVPGERGVPGGPRAEGRGDAHGELNRPDGWGMRAGPGQHAGHWRYGLPELPGARAQIRATSRVAVPGCYATAVILSLAPLLAAGLVEPADVVIVAASGTSGAGRSPQLRLLGAEVMGAVSAYQVGGVHRHIPEIEQELAQVLAAVRASPGWPGPAAGRADRSPGPDAGPMGRPPGIPGQEAGPGGPPPATLRLGEAGLRVCFTPLLAPMPRGILATCTARLAAAAGRAGRSAGGDAVTARLRAALCDAYAGEPFVRVLPEGVWPTTAATAGSNAAHLQVAADTRTGRAIVVAAIDNLGKGAAGQAIQNANLMTGLPEAAGLTANGVAP
jgi:N-acetyl-gamma-glutamyl-phosphate reductase